LVKRTVKLPESPQPAALVLERTIENVKRDVTPFRRRFMTQQDKSNQIKDQSKEKDQSSKEKAWEKDKQLANASALTNDIQERNEKFSSANVKDSAKEVVSAREIEGTIGETRSGLASDIRELNEKFSSANVKDSAKEVMGGSKDAAVEQAAEIKNVVVDKVVEVKDTVVDKAVEAKDAAAEKIVEAKDAMLDTMEDVGEQAKRARSATWRFAKQNAVPLALVGAGVTWLIASNRTSSRRTKSSSLYRPNYEGDTWSEAGNELVERAPRRAASEHSRRPTEPHNGSGRRGALSKTSARLSARAHELKDEASNRVERAENAIASGTSRAVEYVQNAARRAGTATQQFALANPMLVSTAAIAAGVGVGMLLPRTRREDQLFGPGRAQFQRLLGDVKEAATDVAAVAKDTASESMNTLS